MNTYLSIKCENCGSSFVWSVEEQDLYKKRGLAAPKYCPICRGMMEAKEKDSARLKYEATGAKAMVAKGE